MYESIKPIPFSEATGIIKYNMLNDCMFHLVLQKNEYALKGLIAALLHMDPEQIISTEVQNPIHLGETMSEKDFVLDVVVKFNDENVIDLEMQVEDLRNWVPRSLSYLCREYLRLKHGQNYSELKGAYHVGFLDYTLFKDHPEFYSTYCLRNRKDGHIYTDKFVLSVVSLNQIELATDDDKAFAIDKWARAFKATTWEELKMITQNEPYIDSAANSIYGNNLDPDILELCKKRQEEIDGENYRIKRLEELEDENSVLTSEVDRLRSILAANNIVAD